MKQGLLPLLKELRERGTAPSGACVGCPVSPGACLPGGVVPAPAPKHSTALERAHPPLTAHDPDPLGGNPTLLPHFQTTRPPPPPLSIPARTPTRSCRAGAWLEGEYATSRQAELCHAIAVDLGFDLQRGRLDVSVHPFTGGEAAAATAASCGMWLAAPPLTAAVAQRLCRLGALGLNKPQGLYLSNKWGWSREAVGIGEPLSAGPARPPPPPPPPPHRHQNKKTQTNPITGAIHETGHSLYEQGRNLDYDGLPVNQVGGWGGAGEVRWVGP